MYRTILFTLLISSLFNFSIAEELDIKGINQSNLSKSFLNKNHKIEISGTAELSITDNDGNAYQATLELPTGWEIKDNKIHKQTLQVSIHVSKHEGEALLKVLQKHYPDLAEQVEGTAFAPGMVGGAYVYQDGVLQLAFNSKGDAVYNPILVTANGKPEAIKNALEEIVVLGSRVVLQKIDK